MFVSVTYKCSSIYAFQAANAVGAALGKVSGTYDRVIPMKNTTREKAREEAEQVARERAVKEGADEQTLKVIDVMDVPLAYLPGNAVRYYLKVVGDLGDCKAKSPEELSEIGITLNVLGSIYTVRFLSHATSLRRAYNSLTIVVYVRKKCRSILKHVLKHCDNRKSCRTLVVCDKNRTV